MCKNASIKLSMFEYLAFGEGVVGVYGATTQYRLYIGQRYIWKWKIKRGKRVEWNIYRNECKLLMWSWTVCSVCSPFTSLRASPLLFRHSMRHVQARTAGVAMVTCSNPGNQTENHILYHESSLQHHTKTCMRFYWNTFFHSYDEEGRVNHV